MRVYGMPQGLLGVAAGHGGKAFIRVFLCVWVLIACANAEQPLAGVERDVALTRIRLLQYNATRTSPSHTKLTISPTSLVSGTVATAYSTALSASGGTAPYQFAMTGGTVPPGLTFSANGDLSGTPSAAGSFSFTVNVSDATKNSRGNATISVVIQAAAVQPAVSVVISPNTLTASSGSVHQFSASVSNTSNTAVVWSASSGNVSSTGSFTAPTVTSTASVTVRATSVADSSKYAQAMVTVNPPAPAPAISVSISPATTSIVSPNTKQFLASVSNTSNTAVTWSVTAGSITNAGLFTAPNVTSSKSVTVTATSVADPTKFAQAGVTVTAPVISIPSASSSGGDNTYCGVGDVANFGSNDGPAALPQNCINTAIANTPSNGNVTLLPAGGDLQSALNNLACGDTLQLQAGATFTGLFVFPAKNCDSAHWITVRTSTPDASLPSEGTRITPCFAGVGSLPGRPSFNCASVSNVMARIVMNPVPNPGPVQFASGANYYRLIGLEITRPVGTGVVTALVSVKGSTGTSDHIVIDRSWLHGTTQDDTTRGVWLGGTTNFAVVDSFFTDFHCTAVTGSCTDAQTVGGGLGSGAMGPYKIVNNFLEASGENILFGGGAATSTPADIEVRRNHFFKPLIWMKGQAGFVGGSSGNPFVVKNHFELKNAQRVLLEGNIMEYSWGGFSQVGYSVVLTPKNQSNLCPICTVTDITVRYNTISHVAGAFQIANVPSDSGGSSTAGHSYSIHDVTIDDIQAAAYSGPGIFAEVWSQTPLLHDVTINHVTAFPPNTMLMVGGSTTSLMSNFVFTNNLLTTGPYPVWSTGGGTANCAYYDVPITTINACFIPYTFAGNAFIASSKPSTQWPTGNMFPASASDVQFTNFDGGIAGDYTLLSSSPYVTAGTDGKAIGADTGAIASATDGVY